MYQWKELLKTAGWVKQISSDGTTLNSTPGNVNDNITGGAAGAGGFANTGAHWTGLSPDGQRQICIQRGTVGNNNWWCKYSVAAGFTGGTATVAPTAADGQNIFGTAAAGTALFTATMRYHVAANNAAPYGFYAFACTQGTNTITHQFLYDPLVAGSYPAAETDPYVMGCKNGALWDVVGGTGHLQTAAAGAAGIWGFRGNLTTWVNYPLLQIGSTGATYSDGAAGSNPWTAKDDIYSTWYGRTTAVANAGHKGMSSQFKLMASIQRSTYDLLTVVSTGDYISFNGRVAAPWNNVAPVV
jgi:hypothetical protein